MDNKLYVVSFFKLYKLMAYTLSMPGVNILRAGKKKEYYTSLTVIRSQNLWTNWKGSSYWTVKSLDQKSYSDWSTGSKAGQLEMCNVLVILQNFFTWDQKG